MEGEINDTPTIQSPAVVMDLDKLIQVLRDEATDQIRCVVSLDPKAPTIAFTVPDCGSEELKVKVRSLGAVMGQTIDQVFRWTIKAHYEGVDDDDAYDPSVA